MSDQASVVIADDHPIFRKGLRDVIGNDPAFEIVGEASTGQRALELIRTLSPSVAVLDFHMPHGNGLDVAQAIQAERLAAIPVFLTMYKDELTIEAALKNGVRGYVLKDSALTEIADCLHAVIAGKTYITPTLAGAMITRKTTPSPFEALSPTERRVVRLLS